jgi:hypothetical protein
MMNVEIGQQYLVRYSGQIFWSDFLVRFSGQIFWSAFKALATQQQL